MEAFSPCQGCRWRRLAAVRPRRRQRQHALGRGDRGTRRGACGRRARPAAGAGHPLGKAFRLHRRRRRQRLPRRDRPASGRGGNRPRAPRDRPAGKSRDADHCGRARLLPRRRLRGRARLQVSHRHRRRALRLSGSDARPASGSRRHGSLHPADQSDGSDDADADRPHHRRPAREIARRRRCGDAGASCRQCGQGRRQRQAHARKARDAVEHPVGRAGAQLPRDADAQGSRQGRARRALSGALRLDRSLGGARR